MNDFGMHKNLDKAEIRVIISDAIAEYYFGKTPEVDQPTYPRDGTTCEKIFWRIQKININIEEKKVKLFGPILYKKIL